MSLFSKHTNIKYNKKLLKITNIIRYSIWQKAEVSQEHLEYLPKIQIGNKIICKSNTLYAVTSKGQFNEAQLNYCPVIWMFRSRS